jgi:pyruvate, water dikinase
MGLLQVLQHLRERITKRRPEPMAFPVIFEHFQELLMDNQRAMELIADLGEKSGGEYVFDRKYLSDTTAEIHNLLLRLVKGLNFIAENRYMELYTTLDHIFLPLEAELRGRLSLSQELPYVISLGEMPLDQPELTGGKAHALGEIIRRLQLPVPSGFVITARAYRRFIEQNGLEERIHGWLESWLAGKDDERVTSRHIQYSILAGLVPQDVAREIRRQAQSDLGEVHWAVRSSAYGEDGEMSFAGLHETLLQVSPKNILGAYKKVLASLYSPEALIYRRKMGMIGEEAAMAVLCQEMIPSRAAGMVHTVDPVAADPDCLLIYAALGLGRTVAEGRGPLDKFTVERDDPHRLREASVAVKETLLRGAAGGGVEGAAVPPEERDRPALSEDQLRRLVSWALALERYFKRPQEVEWSLDAADNLWLLQSRGLAWPRPTLPSTTDICESCALYPVLIQDRGEVAHAGVGAGPVCRVAADEDLEGFPEGAILVTPYTAPWLARIVPKAAGIIAERGSAAGHLATIAREFRVPALVGVDQATAILEEGREITLDTHHRTVYAGRVKELIKYEFRQATVFEEAPEFRLLRRLLKRIAPLYLIDPQAPDFTPQGCRSVHDVIRFTHEKAVQELMDLPHFLKRFKGTQVWTLVSPLPMDLKILDLGGGIDPEAQGNRVTMEQIRSLPFKALWEGVSAPGVWSTEPVSVDFKGMMSSLTKTLAEAPGMTAYARFNLAVINEAYMNLHLRLGYHFNLVDVRMGPDQVHNHIYFRFVGGVTDLTRRSRRAQLLARILSKHHFKVDTKGDLVVARVLHLPQEEIGRRLQLLGRLIGFTRQLDIQLRRDEDIAQFVEAFSQKYPPPGEGAQIIRGD